ncbi:dnaJ homolog subfamily C member 4-like isoform X2 [Uloborus diversus]|uniref:dnaJ homolog subfamily C member 4-like isoform X2 n=1 Tax=Uloborus diversus TaxID=327109 RepID=UPI002409CEA7|nr:dnaJ homolog subfamily C member 4-like isoform X2 [Uloborus diversus]
MICRGYLITPRAVSKALDEYIVRLYSGKTSNRSPYDVLGLKSSCTTKDVKQAYIKMCKKLHPDIKPGDSSQHKKFVELNDAYTTLVNTDSRRQFDNKSWNPVRRSHSEYQQTSGPYDQGSWNQDSSWNDRPEFKEYFYQHGKTRKVDPAHRIKNIWIVSGCFILVAIGSLLYLIAYNYAKMYTLTKVDERSKMISEYYSGIRKNAEGVVMDDTNEN